MHAKPVRRARRRKAHARARTLQLALPSSSIFSTSIPKVPPKMAVGSAPPRIDRELLLLWVAFVIGFLLIAWMCYLILMPGDGLP